jgi:threonyl-tRNA synthetase
MKDKKDEVKKQKLQIGRHSLAHVLAKAVITIYPNAKLAIGPVIDNGFYYDFDLQGEKIEKENFAKIEKQMKKILNANEPFEKVELTKDQALELYKNNPYKTELINELPKEEAITAYKTNDDFIDLCRGPHVENTSQLQNYGYKIDRVSGAYWRGDEKNKMLTRIYVLAFPSKKELNEYVVQYEDALKRDHNKLGRELNLFMTEENIGQGLPLLMPKGAKVLNILSRFVEDEGEKRGYEITRTPFLAKNNLYKISGHWDHYKEGMFVLGDEQKDKEIFALRPMTCPFQFMIYKNGLKSYKDLPKRYLENSTLFRKESSGEMHGLIRVRQFNLADAHTICTPDQVEKEFENSLEFIYHTLSAIGLREDITFRFSKWDPNKKDKYIDNPEAWEKTQKMLKNILDKLELDYVEAEGEAAFYGPKLDMQIKNVYGKEDTIITVQIDFALAERFDMVYIDENGDRQRPFIIHKSIIGCYERTLALLIEKYAGDFPLWFAPKQVRVMSVTDMAIDTVKEIEAELQNLGIRAQIDVRNEKIGKKIREAVKEKTPYMLIIGEKEANDKTLAVRTRKGVQTEGVSRQDFYKDILFEINNKVVKKDK